MTTLLESTPAEVGDEDEAQTLQDTQRFYGPRSPSYENNVRKALMMALVHGTSTQMSEMRLIMLRFFG